MQNCWDLGTAFPRVPTNFNPSFNQLDIYVCYYASIQFYGVRLQRLNIQSLELRRLHSDLIWCYKIIFGLGDMDSCDFFTPLLLYLLEDIVISYINKKAQPSLTNPRDACEKFARFT